MYAGLLSIIVGATALVVTGYARRSPTIWLTAVFVPLAVSVSVLPLALLIAHVLCIPTVARQTAAIPPFISPTE